MKIFITIVFCLLNLTINAQSKEEFIHSEMRKVKQIPSYSHENVLGKRKPLTVFDSSFSKIVKLGAEAIPVLINKLKDTTTIDIVNPCFTEEKMKVHDLAWFLINEIEPFPKFLAVKIRFCTWNECDHLPDHFFNFVHSDPRDLANRYKKYFYSSERKKYLRSKNL